MVQRSSPEDYFVAQEVLFSVGSSPVAGIPFKVDGAQQVTPYTESTLTTVKTLEAYPTVSVGGKLYVFQMWDDGVTSLSRTVNLEEKTSYLMIYAPVEQAAIVSQQPNYTPLIIVALFIFGIVAICYFAYLGKRR